jgi:hypothetical protein
MNGSRWRARVAHLRYIATSAALVCRASGVYWPAVVRACVVLLFWALSFAALVTLAVRAVLQAVHHG